ncbi:unnamed protein product, partial [Hapterophycus canaliculatus]
MQKILGEQDVTDATAGTLVINSVEGTAAEPSVGWLALARAATLVIRLEVEPSRSRSNPSRDLQVVEKNELDSRVLALAACPRCSQRGDDLFVAMENLSWELLRLHPTELPLESAMGKRRVRVDLSVVASGIFGSGPRRSFDAASRATSPRMALRLNVWGGSPEMVRTPSAPRRVVVKTLVACACGSAITMLAFFRETSGEEERSRSGDSIVLRSTSVMFPLTPDILDIRSRSEIPISGPRNLHDQPEGQQSHAGLDITRRQGMPPLAMSFDASAVQNIVILSGERYRSVEPAGNGCSSARDAYSPAIVALSLINEDRGEAGADFTKSCDDRTSDDRQAKLVRTFRWDLRGGGGGNLRPGHWFLANLHPETCIAGLATGGLLCVDPEGVKAYTEDGIPFLDVGQNALGRNVEAATPSFTRSSWGANARPVAVTRFDLRLRKREPNRQRHLSSEDFLVADISGILHYVSVFVGSSVRDSSGGSCPEEDGTGCGRGSSRSGYARIQCTNLGLSSGDVPCRLRHHLRLLLPVGSKGLVVAVARSSPFPIFVRIPLAPRSPSNFRIGSGERIRTARTASWQLLEAWEERLSSPSLGPVSQMVVLPGVRSDEQEVTWLNRTSDKNGKLKIPAHTPPELVSSSAFANDYRNDLPGTLETVAPRGLRVALATGTVCPSDASARKDGSANDPANSIGILEHGLRLETTAEGSIGLPAGAILFAQPVPVENAGRRKSSRCGQSSENKKGGRSDRRKKDKQGMDGTGETGHLLLLSDRVRSKTHVMFKLPSGEVVPARYAAAKGFDSDRHTVHLGRVEPLGYIVQVTADSVNILRSSAWSEESESVACWRPLPRPSSCPLFKAQYAGTAGAVVVVACESTMVVIEVRDAVATAAAAVVNRPKTMANGDRIPKITTTHTTTAREVRRAELDGGPVSAMGMRSFGNHTPEEGKSMAGEKFSSPRVLIATASWDSPAITVHSFSARSTGASIHAQAALPKGQQMRDELCDGDALLKDIATWHPPWGGSVPHSASSDGSHGGAGTAGAEEFAGERRESNCATLTRALAFVKFKDEAERVCVVAATADGAVAVGDWQQRATAGEDDQDNTRGRGGPKRQQTIISNSSTVTLVTVASFQVGQGPVRLAVFRSPGLVGRADAGDDGDYVESVLLNGEMMDAVVHRCREAPSLDQSLRGWQCTQVCRVGGRRRESLVHLPQRGKGMASGGSIENGFAWLATKEPRFDPKHHEGDLRDHIIAGSDVGASQNFSQRELSLCFGTFHGSEPWGGLCHKTPLPWTPTHLVYVPVTRSIVVAFQTSSDDVELYRSSAAGAQPRDTQTEARPLSSSLLSSSSTLRIYDADTLEERPGTGPLRLLPGVRVTGMALLPGYPRIFGGTATTSTAIAAAQVIARIDRHGRNFARPAEASAVGGDVIAVACYNSAKTTSTKEVENGRNSTGDGGFGWHDEDEGRTPGSERLNRSDVLPSRSAPTTVPSAVSDEPHPSSGKAASAVTVLAAYEVVAFSTTLTPLAASPEMVGACFSVEALGTRFVAVSNNERVVVFGWEGREEGLRTGEPAPPLKLAAQARCRTPSGRCVTALATCKNFVAVAEFLHCVCLYRFDETLRELTLVATHSRDNLVVTALELSVRPIFPSAFYSVEEGSGEGMAALLAVADLTTRTVAVLACPGIPLTNSSTSDGSIYRGGDIGSGEEANHTTRSCIISGNDHRSDGGGSRRCTSAPGTAAVGSQDRDVALLRLVSVWPCQDKVTSLAS